MATVVRFIAPAVRFIAPAVRFMATAVRFIAPVERFGQPWSDLWIRASRSSRHARSTSKDV